MWQTRAVERFQESGLDRAEALRRMTGLYLEHAHTNEPVHTWALP